jgi:hypothetical protein
MKSKTIALIVALMLGVTLAMGCGGEEPYDENDVNIESLDDVNSVEQASYPQGTVIWTNLCCKNNRVAIWVCGDGYAISRQQYQWSVYGYDWFNVGGWEYFNSWAQMNCSYWGMRDLFPYN